MGLATVVVFICLAFLVLTALAGSVAWVWRDANRRGQPGFIVAVLVAFLFWPLSLVVWLAARPAVPGGTATPRRSGRGCLWAVLIIVIILGLFILTPLFLLVPSRSMPVSAGNFARRAKCENNVRQLALMYIMYSTDHGGTPPRGVEDLRTSGTSDETWARILHCPAVGTDGPPSYRLFPGTNATDIIVQENWHNHGGKGGAIAFGDGRVEWVDSPCKPIRMDVVKEAVERQLRQWFDTFEKRLLNVLPEGFGDKSVRVGAVTFDAQANCYHVEVHWQVQGRDRRSVMRLDQAGGQAGISRYSGMFGLILDNVPAGISNPLNLPVEVDELMDGSAVEKERP